MRRVLAAVIAMLLGMGALVGAAWPQRPGSLDHLAAPFATSNPKPAAVAARPAALTKRVASRRQNEAARAWTRAPNYLVVLVLDGARPDYFSVPGIPHIQALMRQGTQYTNAWAGILESETPSGHATIGTGSEPRQDGIPSFSWATSDNIPVSLFDPNSVRQGALENLLTQARVPSIASLVHKADPKARVVALSGHKYYAADAIGGPSADVIMYYSGTPDGKFAPTFVPGHGPPADVLARPNLTYPTNRLPVGVEDQLTMKLATATFNRLHQRVTLINVPEFDWPLGHVWGGDRDAKDVRLLMQSFDRDLAGLENAYRNAGVLGRTLFVLTADHGLAPIYYRISKTSIQQAVWAAHTSIVSDAYHTAAYLWVKYKSRAAAAAQNIANLRNPYIQSVYYKTWSRAKGYYYVMSSDPRLFRARRTGAANQYLLQSFDGPNGPDVVALFAEGAGSEPGGQARWKGDHGGASWESQHVPLIISGPGARQGYVSPQPARLMDLAPTALALMGISSNGMHGIPLADAWQSAPAAARAVQSAEAKVVAPVVRALKWESRLDLAAHR